MSTPHNAAENGAFAKAVLMPGDPLRAKFIAETFLENPKLVTSVRNVLGYTGTYNGREISVMASGMGMPSIGIYSYELFTQYGVETIVRIGSAGSYVEDLNIYDVNSYAGKLLISYLPPIDKSKYFDNSFWEDNIRVDEYPGYFDPNESIQITWIKLKYGEN